MQIGKAFYCDDCGVNIQSGNRCSACDPQHGTQEVSTVKVMYSGDSTKLAKQIEAARKNEKERK